MNGYPKEYEPRFRRIGPGTALPLSKKGEGAMSIRKSRLTMGLLAVAAMTLLPSLCWAIYYKLDPSKDDWGLKYDVEVSDADGDKANVVFTLADEGRLKPIYSATVVAFSKPDKNGGRTYDVKAPIEFKTTKDGKRVGQVQIPKKYADSAEIRILTLTVNGRRNSAASYYDLPLHKNPNKDTTVASPPAEKALK